MVGLKVEETGVGVAFFEEMQPRPLLDYGTLQGREAKAFCLPFFTQGQLLGR
jgi:hypothetical protein